MAWLPEGEKILMICLFVLTKFTNVTDIHTDRQTPHDDIGRACIASRGKNRNDVLLLLSTVSRGRKLHCCYLDDGALGRQEAIAIEGRVTQFVDAAAAAGRVA